MAAHLLVDGADPTILRVATQLRHMPLAFDSQRSRAAVPATFEIRPYYNPEGRTAVNIIPGLIGIILTLTMMLFTAVAIVREREQGNLELLINTPISTTELMVGKIVPYILIGLVQLALIIAVGKLLFDVPIRGSVLDLYLAAVVFIAANLALGLFVSTLVRTQFQAMQVTFFVILPSILLSGFMFPFEGMPRPAQWLAELFPLTHFLRLVRGIVLRDADLVMMHTEIWPLLAFFVAFLTLSTIRFNKRLD
jgi:ABC-2 type transport system permease protein